MSGGNAAVYRRALLIEKLASLEHEQWMTWARNLMDREKLSRGRRDRWLKLMIPYSDLSAESQEQDRRWALKIMDTIRTDIEEHGPL